MLEWNPRLVRLLVLVTALAAALANGYFEPFYLEW